MNKFILWGFLLLFIIIFFGAFYGPAGLLQKIANIALSAERFIPDKPIQELRHDESLPQATLNTQQKFIGEVSAYDNIGNCLLSFSSLTNLGDSKLELVNGDGFIQVRIEKPSGKEKTGGIGLNVKDIDDKNLQVCVIDSKPFYDCHLSGNNDCRRRTYKIFDRVRVVKDEIIFDDNSRETIMDQILFKPENDKICFIPTHKGLFTSIGCDAKEDTIDNDCIEEINENIQFCYEKTLDPCEGICKSFVDDQDPCLAEDQVIDLSYSCPSGLVCCVPSP